MWDLIKQARITHAQLAGGSFNAVPPGMDRLTFPYNALRATLSGNVIPEANSRAGIWINEYDTLGRQLSGAQLARIFVDSTAVIDAGAKLLTLEVSTNPGGASAAGALDAAGDFKKTQYYGYVPPPLLGVHILLTLGATGVISDADGLLLELWGFREH